MSLHGSLHSRRRGHLSVARLGARETFMSSRGRRPLLGRDREIFVAVLAILMNAMAASPTFCQDQPYGDPKRQSRPG